MEEDMPVTVKAAGDQGTSLPETPVPESRHTPLLSLKQRREDLKKKLYIDLPVPRWGPDLEIVVRYGPVDNNVVEKALEYRQNQFKQGGQIRAGWSILVNADVLVHSCIGIYAIIDNDGIQRSLKVNEPEAPWTRFDPDLAENLGLDPIVSPSAVDACRALYQTDGDLLIAANKLFEWSGESTEKLEEDFTRP
jgi:hypothetical protein